MGKEIRVGIPPPGRKIKKSKKEAEEPKKEVEEPKEEERSTSRTSCSSATP